MRDNHYDVVHGRSCLTSLIEISEEVTKKFDEARALEMVFIEGH